MMTNMSSYGLRGKTWKSVISDHFDDGPLHLLTHTL